MLRASFAPVLVFALLLVVFRALAGGEVPDIWLAVIATVVTQLLRWIGLLIKKPIGQVWAVGAFFLISVGLAWWAKAPTLPALPVFGGEPFVFALAIVGFVGAVLTAAGEVFVYGHVLYKTLMQKAVFPLVRFLNF